MGKTKIQWCTHNWNIVLGCSRKSPGCLNCYAERQMHRFNQPGMYAEGLTVIRGGRPGWSGKIVLREDKLEEPLRWKKPRTVFVCSTSDLFHEDVPFGFLDRAFAVMRQAEAHTFQVLTKRIERYAEYAARPDFEPPPNVWVGTSVEDRVRAQERIPILAQAPASVRFLSCEPLLEGLGAVDLTGIHWAIMGGESGPGARNCAVEWIADLIAAGRRAGAAVFVKQLGARPTLNGAPLSLESRKGDEPSQWPSALRVREFPEVSP